MLNLDQTILNAVVERAVHDAAASGRWLVAIGRAAYELETNCYLERSVDGLLIGSSSGVCYHTTSTTCSCTAATFNQPCWHRSAVRIVERHDEQVAAALFATLEPMIVKALERQLAPLNERLTKARAEMAELFA